MLAIGRWAVFLPLVAIQAPIRGVANILRTNWMSMFLSKGTFLKMIRLIFPTVLMVSSFLIFLAHIILEPLLMTFLLMFNLSIPPGFFLFLLFPLLLFSPFFLDLFLFSPFCLGLLLFSLELHITKVIINYRTDLDRQDSHKQSNMQHAMLHIVFTKALAQAW